MTIFFTSATAQALPRTEQELSTTFGNEVWKAEGSPWRQAGPQEAETQGPFSVQMFARENLWDQTSEREEQERGLAEGEVGLGR